MKFVLLLQHCAFLQSATIWFKICEAAMFKISFWISGLVYFAVGLACSIWFQRMEFCFALRERMAWKLLSSGTWPLMGMFCLPIIIRTSAIDLNANLFRSISSTRCWCSCCEMFGLLSRCTVKYACPLATAEWWSVFALCLLITLLMFDQSLEWKQLDWVPNKAQ